MPSSPPTRAGTADEPSTGEPGAAPRDPSGDRRTGGAGHADASTRRLPVRTVLLGALGSLLLLAGSFGGAGVLVHDPVLSSGPLSAMRYGHGRDMALAVLYSGFGVLVWAWVRLGRGVLAGLVGSRGVLLATAAWIAPMLIAPPLFTRDVYSYLGQGLLALHGMDPYGVGPSALIGPIPDNVHPTWQTTPAPYGPLFMGIAKGVILLAGEGMISSVIVMRLVLLCGLAMLIFALPGLVAELGGRLPVALWLVAASPMTVVHLVGGPHNDMLMIGLLALGVLLALRGRHAAGVALLTLAMSIKATAGVALPFLVWIWAARLPGNRRQRLVRAGAASVAVFVPVFAATMALAKVGFGWLPALSAPGMIVNYLSAPTGLGQAVHGVVAMFAEVDRGPFVETGRTLGSLVLAALLARLWWRARDGGTNAVRCAALALLAAAALSPVVLPWYLTWGLALGCALPWSPRALSYVVGASVALVLAYYPDGEQAMYNLPFVAVGVGAALLAALSLQRFDPLGLGRCRTVPGGRAGPPGRGDRAAADHAEGSTCVLSPVPERNSSNAVE
ncbi:polyprenol phosphomannose-dependent alpha 1,6 mannosyltransferase MptB [Saccharopolyspora sp. HNM0986]|uniref:polyprenol phosphomannose-dependent alpha 1,6 mannosyltransferase MptB n=1 Tax=Saccharopolyspora galaxeae TaxID=2781241 RepID=UPI00190BA360|nr:polyprenol phosphomannose-dependent alpha 1,6 mannosyltransferase MptB [Saccharopolyspora sp. HNM0986]MBK0868516.1 polyprenol phosphomannose-dependent alpha 1,6 mannosyltransferase MptB [Saccharopolyspora sp. HNM0986]